MKLAILFKSQLMTKAFSGKFTFIKGRATIICKAFNKHQMRLREVDMKMLRTVLPATKEFANPEISDSFSLTLAKNPVVDIWGGTLEVVV